MSTMLYGKIIAWKDGYKTQDNLLLKKFFGAVPVLISAGAVFYWHLVEWLRQQTLTL